MALPDLRLLRDDMFVINRRITANDVETYKVNAEDIGVFLLETPRPPGSSPDDKFVNDGPLNVYGEIPGGADYINLHSANEYCEGKLNFREGFYVTGADMDVTIHHDYAEISKNLACLNGGIDGTTTCLKLDMKWLSEHIICPGSGMATAGDCIFIDLCPHSGLVIDNTGCLEVSLCPGRGIIHDPNDGCLDVDLSYLSSSLSCEGLQPQNGDPNSVCMEIDMVWLSANIRCGDPTDNSAENGSGLIDEQGCIRVDPCWVSDQYNVTNNNPPNDTGSIDINQCEFAINEDWLQGWAEDNINDILPGKCATVSTNANLFKGDVTVGVDEGCLTIDWSQLVNIPFDPDELCLEPCDGGGGGSGATICTGDGIKEDNKGCIALDDDDEACATMGRIDCNGITQRGEGTNNRPAYAYGLKKKGPNEPNKYDTYLGLTGSSSSGRYRVTYGWDWDFTDSSKCGGNPQGGSYDILSFDLGIDYLAGDVTLPGGGQGPSKGDFDDPNGAVTCKLGTVPNDDAMNSQPNMSISDQGRVRRLKNPKFFELTDQDSSNNVDVANFDIETVLENIMPKADTTLNSGIVKWKISSKIGVDGLNRSKARARPTIDVDALANISPTLVNWDWSPDDIEEYEKQDFPDSEIYTGIRVKDGAQLVPDSVNWPALQALQMAGLRNARRRIQELESEITDLQAKTTREGTLNTLGIVEYTNETAAVNSGLGQGEVYWDTTLNRMRAVT